MEWSDQLTYQQVEEMFLQEVASGVIDTPSHEVKKFKRFEYFWKTRTQTSDPAHQGKLKSYVNQLRWQYANSPWCTVNENPTPWQLLGPVTSPGGTSTRHDMGIVVALWAEPGVTPVTEVLAGTNASGLWRGTNNLGQWSWECLTDGIRVPGMGIGSIAVTDQDDILIGTGGRGDYSAGVWISDDNGASWTNLPDFNPDSHSGTVADIKFYEGNIYIVERSKVYRASSTANLLAPGVFTDITPAGGIGGGGSFNKLVHYRQDANNAALVLTSYLKGGRNHGAKVYMSIDEGNSWTDITNQFATTVTALDMDLTISSRFVGQSPDPDTWDLNAVPPSLSIQPNNATTALVAYDSPDGLIHDGTYEMNMDLVKDPNCILRVHVQHGDMLPGTPPDLTDSDLLHEFALGTVFSGNVTIPVINTGYPSRLVFEAVFTGSNPGIVISGMDMTTDDMELFVADVVNDPSSAHKGAYIIYKPVTLYGGSGDFPVVRMSNINQGFTSFHTFSPSDFITSAGTMLFSENGGQFKITRNGNIYIGGPNNTNSSQNIRVFWPFSSYSTFADTNDGHADTRSIYVVDDSNNGAEIVIKGDDGGVSLCTNGGSTSLDFTSLEGTGLPITQFYGMGVDDKQTLIVAGAQDNGTFEYTFTPSGWTRPGGCDGGMSRSFSSFNSDVTAKSRICNSGTYLTVNGATCGSGGSHWSGTWALGNPVELYFDKQNEEVKLLLSHGNLFTINCNGTSVDNMSTITGGYNNFVTGIGIHEEDDQVMFIGGNRISWDGNVDVDNGLLRTRDGGTTWDDITSRLRFTDPGGNGGQPLAWFSITDVVVDPDVPADQPATVYVSFAGWNQDGTKRVYKSVDDGEHWEDISTGLGVMGVNDLELQKGSGGILYAGTDAGVYVYDPQIAEWRCFNEDFPIMIVTEVKTNPCTGKLFASTFGRGIWFTDQYEYERKEVLVVDQDMTIDGHIAMRNDISIEPGATLTITGTLLMYPDRKIDVKPNGRLWIKGGTITSYCGGFWPGIWVWGDNTENQTGYPVAEYQGVVKMTKFNNNDPTIEHAREAVRMRSSTGAWNTFGGIIEARDAQFINCRRAVEFMSYTNANSIGAEINNRSYFANCDFIVNDDYRGGNDFYAHVSMWEVSGMRFSACRFTNEQTTISLSENLGHGIISLDSKFYVTGQCATLTACNPGQPIQRCPPDDLTYSEFIGLDHGINASQCVTGRTFSVSNTKFINNVCGIYTSMVNNFSVTWSEFIMGFREGDVQGQPITLSGSVDPLFNGHHRGIHNYFGNGFRVEENHFHRDPQALTAVEAVVIGYTESHNDQVYKNTCHGVDGGVIGEGRCVNTSNGFQEGLSFECNSSDNNIGRDFVYRIPPNDAVPLPLLGQYCIRYAQGSSTNEAGDSFTPNNLGPYSYWQFDNENHDNTNITYYHTAGTGPDPAGIIGVNSSAFTQPLPYGQNACDTRIICGGKEVVKSAKQQIYDDAYSAYLNLKYVYESTIDGGDYEELEQTIMQTWPSEAWELRDQLLAESPYLSVDILMDVAQQNVLPDAMMLEVCVANPEATREENFTYWIAYEAPNPLPQYMVDQIVASWDQESWRSTLEAGIGEQLTNMAVANDHIIGLIRMDSIADPLDSILLRWQMGTGLSSEYGEVQTLIEMGLYEDARTILNELEQEFELKDEDVLERDDMLKYVDQLEQIAYSGRSMLELEGGQLDELTQLAEGEYTRAAILAQNLLCFAYGTCFEPLTGGSMGLRSVEASNSSASERSTPLLFVHPNPATTFVSLEYRLPNYSSLGFLSIQDVQGRQVLRVPLAMQEGQYLWDTRMVRSGVYLVELHTRGEVQSTQRVVIK